MSKKPSIPGRYRVTKVRQVACFSYGKTSSTFATQQEALDGLRCWFEKRADKKVLTIEHIPETGDRETYWPLDRKPF